MRVVNETPIVRTPRVIQVESMMDVPQAERSVVEWDVDLPLVDRDWNVGLIVGPSGAGKSTVARALFGEKVVDGFEWPDDRSVLDAFPDGMSIRDITSLITSVGFGSVPSWLRPYRALSTGEQFRVSMARAIAERPDPIVVDEFTSTVDRQVAQVASHTVQKALRRSDRKFVAVTCHYDVIDWLQPDWVYQPHDGSFAWRSLQRRPDLELSVHAADRSAWRLFAPHHYLSRDFPGPAKAIVGTINGVPAVFGSYMHTVHPSRKTRNIRTIPRLVVLPDYQGLGLGSWMVDWLGEWLAGQGWRPRITLAHPGLIRHLARSPRWRLEYAPTKGAALGHNTSTNAHLHRRFTDPRTLRTWCFEYQPASP
jgi:ABC-type lipoprotein export system ATPase subunit